MNKNLRKTGEPEVQVTSLKSTVLWLKSLLKNIDNPNDLKAFEIILHEIAKCTDCKGLGSIVVAYKPETNYKVSKRINKNYYMIPCSMCKGEGKILSIECSSCGKLADIMPMQRHVNHCSECEARLLLNGTLL